MLCLLRIVYFQNNILGATFAELTYMRNFRCLPAFLFYAVIRIWSSPYCCPSEIVQWTMEQCKLLFSG